MDTFIKEIIELVVRIVESDNFKNLPLPLQNFLVFLVVFLVVFVIVAFPFMILFKLIKPNQILGDIIKKIQQKKLYTLVGQIKEETLSESMFQNFEVSRNPIRKNPNPIYFMWADTYAKSYINAFIEKYEKQQSGEEKEYHYLKVLFLNNSKWKGNIAILPHDFFAIKREKDKKYLTFKAKRLSIDPHEEEYSKSLSENEKLLSDIGISIRLVDAELQHWIYFPDSRDATVETIAKVSSEEYWAKFAVDIENQSKWQQFKNDGNYLYGSKKPDFSVITLVILKFGGYNEMGLTEGFGSIGIRDICLKSELEGEYKEI